jgi:hypothetical protein
MHDSVVEFAAGSALATGATTIGRGGGTGGVGTSGTLGSMS